MKRKSGEPEEIRANDELSACPRCGYGGGFHVAFRRRDHDLAVFLICPACSARFSTGAWTFPAGPLPEQGGG